MPKKSGKNPLNDKYGKRLMKAHNESKDKQTEFGSFSDLPPGINNGIARLVDCRIGTYEKGDNEGENFFYAAGIVVSPKSHNGEIVKSGRTSIMEPLCDTPGRSREDFEAHLDWVYNELRKLGMDTSDLEATTYEELIAELSERMEELKGDPEDESTWTYFKFRTWQGKPTPQYPDPRTNHTWNGACDWEDEDTEDEDTEDETEAPPKKAAATKTPPKPSKTPEKPSGKKPPVKGAKAKAPEPEPDEDEGEAFDEFGDLEELAKKADKGDDKAGKALKEIAVKLGINGKKIDNAEDWVTVVGWIDDVREVDEDAEETSGDEEGAGEGDEEAAEDDFEPMKEDVYDYHPLDAKTKKPSRKPVQCEVTAVNMAKKVVTLKTLDGSDKTFKAVPFDDLVKSDDND